MPDIADRTNAVDLLRTVPLFRRLDPKHLRALAAASVDRTFDAGESILFEGDEGVGFYLVAEGEAVVEKSGKTVGTLRPGEFFGEMALLYGEPRSASVRAVGRTRCLVLAPSSFWGTVGDDPEALRALLLETVRRLREAAPAVED